MTSAISIGEWVALASFAFINLSGFIGLWTRISVDLKLFKLRIEQLEADRHETRKDVKALTTEVHNLVVELARMTGINNHD